MESNINQKLLKEIIKMRPVEFIGLANLLGVKLLQEKNSEAENLAAFCTFEKYEPRSFTDVLGDVMARFNSLNRKRKREILELVQKANRGERDARNPKNT